MSESRFHHVSREGKLTPLASVAEVVASRKEGGFVWLDYCKPTREELTSLVEPFGLHPLAVEDCTDDTNQVPKIEDFPKNTFLLFHAFDYTRSVLTITEVGLFIGEDFLVTVCGPDAGGKPLFAGLERVFEREAEGPRQGPASLMHVLLDHVVDRKFTAIEALEEELDRAEETMLDDLSRFDPKDLLRMRHDLLSLRKSLFHEREILVKICRKDCPFIGEKVIFFYRDIYDHLAKFFELTESSREIVTSLMEMYLSMLNIQMARAANETNRTVRRLTLITTIFMPLTLLAGVGGMSEWSMMTGPANWKLSYPLFMVAMVVIAVANYYALRWLERGDQDGGGPSARK